MSNDQWLQARSAITHATNTGKPVSSVWYLLGPMLRVLQVGLGPLGRRIANDLYERGQGEVVAAIDVSAGLAGTKLAGLVPAAKPQLVVQRRVEDVREWSSIDCAIVATDSSLERCEPTFRDLLAHGLTVVSTCEELCFPYARHPRLI